MPPQIHVLSETSHICVQKLVDCESDENLPVNVFAVSRTQEEGIMNLIVQSFFRNEDVSVTVTTLINR